MRSLCKNQKKHQFIHGEDSNPICTGCGFSKNAIKRIEKQFTKIIRREVRGELRVSND